MSETRYCYGGDEFILVELSDEMSLEANFKAVSICNALRAKELPGIVDVCQSNASYQVWFDPDDATAFGRTRLRQGKDDFKKIYRFTQQGVFRHRRR